MRWARSGDVWPTLFTVGLVLTGLGLAAAVWLGVSSVPLPPGGVAQAFYEAVNDGDFEAAEGYLSRQARDELALLTGPERAALFSQLSNGHTLQDVMRLGVRNYGDRAVVGLLLQFEDHTAAAVRTDELVREGTRWRLTWPVGERSWNDLVEPYDRVRTGP